MLVVLDNPRMAENLSERNAGLGVVLQKLDPAKESQGLRERRRETEACVPSK